MKFIIFEEVGWGYSKLAVVVDAALREIGLKRDIEVIANARFFHKYGVKSTPALSIDGEIVFEGYEPSLNEMIKLLSKTLT